VPVTDVFRQRFRHTCESRYPESVCGFAWIPAFAGMTGGVGKDGRGGVTGEVGNDG